MWKELGISSGTFIVVCFVLYFVIKWAVGAGMEKTNKLLKDILAAQSAGGSELSNTLAGRAGKVCRIHLNTDSEHYFTMGGEFTAKIVSANGGWVDITDIQPTGSGNFSGTVSLRITDISYVENVDENI